ncbi:hypothetical protein [Nafulsella turpanensis]|uniref:hypothetical protein n=1 Tax=Nafulsella turpanensis TaxID=1265690 RepID=UPI0003457EB3|nr:hypothetical protein [Nafulsella turpanensis]
MQEFQFLFEQSPWFILLCLLAGLAFAWLLYKPAAKQSWSRSINFALFAIRFLVVSLLALLLLGPYVKQLKRTFEEPTFVIAVDNSLSLAEVYDSAQLENIRKTVKELEKALGEEAAVQVRSLSGILPADSLRFQEKSTNLSQLMTEVSAEYENRNLAGLVLLSDGIYNRGLSPAYTPASFPVYTLGLGDTIPKKDLNLKALYYNKIAYQGNQFRLLAELEQNGFEGESAVVSVSYKGEVLAQKEIQLRENQPLYETEFILEATTEGLQHYVVSITPKKAEFTISNNSKHAYIEVVEGQEKILIAAPAPHPDIKAIRSAIEKNENYEVSLYIPGISEFKPDKYDLLILHQLPSRQSVPQLEEVLNSSKAHWYIIGRQTNIPAFNERNKLLSIEQRAQEFDEVFPVYNPAFPLFTYPAELVALLNEYPPVLVPFGQVTLKGEAATLLYQKVGNIATERPLLVMQTAGEQKTAVLLGEGIWQWRLQEWAQAEQFTAFDELVQKTVQLLSAKEDRRPFKVYPIEREVYDTEGVTFETEVYNQLYERIWGQEIKLTLTNEAGEQKTYQYTNSRNNPRYTISNLPQGVYTYQASTTRQGEQLTSSGEFTVNELQLESLELTADFNLLRKMAAESGGAFYPMSEADELKEALRAKEFKSTVYAVEDFLPIIHLKWLFFLILLLISAEWFIRKYNGSY